MKRTQRWIFLLVLLSVAGLISLLFLEKSPSVPTLGAKKDSVLILNLHGEIPELPMGGFTELMGDTKLTFRHLLDAIRAAGEDPNVKGCLVTVAPVEMGWAQIQELRDALQRFNETGKPLMAYLEIGEAREYYLASVAEKLFFAPEAMIHIGLISEAPFLSGILAKLKIEPDFIFEGKYKSAPETFTRDSMSDPQREEMNAILDSVQRTLQTDICASREIDSATFQLALDKTFLNAKMALEYGLVDRLAYPDEFVKAMKDELAVEEIHKSYPVDFVSSDGSMFSLTTENKIAVVYMIGVIGSGASTNNTPFGDYVGSNTVWRQLDEIRKDDSIQAVILRIDSPGGSGLAADIIWRAVNMLKEKKPVIASMSNTAASGGYYIAMAANGIVAEPLTFTGSIGVFMGKFNLRGFYDWIGVTFDQMKRGQQADVFSDLSKFSPPEREMLQGFMSDFYKTFVSKAAEGRGKTYDEIHAVAQGRVWTGTDALQVGLVDEIGGLDEAIALAKKKAGIPDDQKVQIVVYPHKKGIFDYFKEDPGKFEMELPSVLKDLAREEALAKMMDREKILALAPELMSK